MDKLVLGIDIGGTGIKGALIDVETGELVSEKIKVATPSPSTPDKLLSAVTKLIASFDWSGKPIGIGFPSTIKNGVVMNASNIDESWINYPLEAEWTAALQCQIHLLNDADAAGMAEMQFGIGKDLKGTIIFMTLGTGIGSAIFVNGNLIANTELGHVLVNKKIGEKMASNSARELKGMTWKAYGKALNQYLQRVEFLLNPDYFIIGGGISKKFEMYKPLLTISAQIFPAKLQNDAGIIGSAVSLVRQ
jgi:polyphosphate glucokinase